MAIPLAAADRRLRQRQRSLLRGRICYGPHAAISIECVIRNLSSDGALLQAPGEPPIPSAFTLLHVTEGISFEAQVVWRRGELVGVSLGDRHDLKGIVDAQLDALRGIWLALAPR